MDLQQLAEAIAAALAQHLKPADPNQMYDHSDLAKLFKVSRSTILRKAKEENWPRTRFGTDGKTDRFSTADIEAIKAIQHKAPKTKTVPNVGTRAKRRNNK